MFLSLSNFMIKTTAVMSNNAFTIMHVGMYVCVYIRVAGRILVRLTVVILRVREGLCVDIKMNFVFFVFP